MLLISCGERVPLVFLGFFVCLCKQNQNTFGYTIVYFLIRD